MEIIIIIAVVAVLLFYFIIVKSGHLSFWQKAARNPDVFYEQLLKDDAWLIDDGTMQIDKEKYVGPYHLYVPSIGKAITFYGKIGKYEDSQKRIEKELSKIK